MATVEVERSVLENIYNALHWYVSRECDSKRVTEELLSDMNKVSTILSCLPDKDAPVEKWLKLNEDIRNRRYVWSKDGEFMVFP